MLLKCVNTTDQSTFFYLLPFHNLTLLLDAMLNALILRLSFFTHGTLFKSITSSNKSTRTKISRVIFIKIVIIKVRTIKVYSNKAHNVTKQCKNIRVYIINPIQEGLFWAVHRKGGGWGKQAPCLKSVVHILQ